MLTAFGVMAIVLAGFALPMALDGGESDAQDAPDASNDPSVERDPDDEAGSSPLDEALAPSGFETPDMSPPEASDAHGSQAESGPSPIASAPDPAVAARQEDLLDIGVDPPAPSSEGNGTGPGGPPTADMPLEDRESPGIGPTAEVPTDARAAQDDDVLFGGSGDGMLEGGAGDDHLADGWGNDTLLGGSGNDTLNAAPADGEAGRDGTDILDGGDGNDMLLLSAADSATGGGGADMFLAGPGLVAPGTTPGPPPEITDFEPGRDVLTIVWNDFASAPPPVIEAVAAADGSGALEVQADGTKVATLNGLAGIGADSIRLLPASQFRI